MADNVKWLYAKTLLAGDPDINRRTLVYDRGGAGHQDVAIFNAGMQPWPSESTAMLEEVVRLLNELEYHHGK